MQPIRNFDLLLQCAKGRSSKGIAVAVPYDKNTLLAVKDALDSGLTTAQLFGDQSRILPILEQSTKDRAERSKNWTHLNFAVRFSGNRWMRKNVRCCWM